MINYKNLKNKVINFLSHYKYFFLKNHKRENLGGNKWMFISYITEPFKKKNDTTYFNGHQNRQETLIIEQITKDLGFSYIFNEYNRPLNFVKRKFDVVFGLEPNFKALCDKNNKAIKIYYATGAYYQHQNSMIINRTKDFERKYKIKYSPKRLVKPHESCEVADYIFQIGSKFTVETYPTHLRDKIMLINQTGHVFKNINITEKINKTSTKDFIWFGSSGTILKGLDLVLECFFINKNLNLHVVGPVEDEFLEIFADKITTSNNIFLYGFLDVDSKEFRDLANKCAFLIFPSASEGGAPGSVINLQILGVIPILSRWASPNTIEELGYLLKDIDISSIIEAIHWSQRLTDADLSDLIVKNHKYIIETHTPDRFKNEFKGNFELILSRNKSAAEA